MNGQPAGSVDPLHSFDINAANVVYFSDLLGGANPPVKVEPARDCGKEPSVILSVTNAAQLDDCCSPMRLSSQRFEGETAFAVDAREPRRLDTWSKVETKSYSGENLMECALSTR